VRSVFNAATRAVTGQYFGRYASASYFGRINYQLHDKYLLTVNLRHDGSPRFAPQHRWGTFPSIAVGWKLHEENFMQDQGLFSELKLRGSWGISGNDAIGDFRYLSRVWTNGVYYPFGSDPIAYPGATVVDDAAHDIVWESTESKTI